jgi:hypothetical protein
MTAEICTKYCGGLPVHRAGFKLPYFTINGELTKFFRYRYLEYGLDAGFGSLVSTNGNGSAKLLRYSQSTGSLNEVYFPPLGDNNWSVILKDPSKPVVITEGELKSACGTKSGVPTIGLGGVWMFRSTDAGLHLLPQLQKISWKDRRVTICFDSDATTNPNIALAENVLARELFKLGAKPFVARIPPLVINGKTGIDDFIALRGGTEFFEKIVMKAMDWEEARELFMLNEEVIYVCDPGMVIETATHLRMSPKAFVDHVYAPRKYHRNEPDAKGGNKVIEKPAAREWIKWEGRAAAARLTYRPGYPKITDDKELNLWHGWNVEPKPGNVEPWHQLVDYLFQYDKGSKQWFEQWLAYPLQHPGEKLFSAVVLWGIVHGTGKSLIGYTMFKIYGENGTEIGDRDLYSNHNEWAENRQFVMADEITGGDKRSTADRMKSMITQKQLRINPKYVSAYTVPDCINYYFTSNHPDAFFMEDTDRRFFIHEVVGCPLDNKFYRQYVHWLDHGGSAALFDYFLKLDLEGFNPQGHALTTVSKTEMIDLGRSDVADWVSRIRREPDQVLAINNKPLFYSLWTTLELHALYDPLGTGKLTPNGMARELRRAGFRKAYNGMSVNTSHGSQRLWILRRESELLTMSPSKIAAWYDRERKGTRG